MSRPPRLRVAPPRDLSYGDLAADLAGDYGLVPDDWQAAILDDWLAENRGRYSALTCGLSLSRQNGKNVLVEIRELFGMVGRGEKFLHTAHQVKTAQRHFRRLKYFFGKSANDPDARFPELNALVREVRNVNGQEGIYLANGGSVELVARSKDSGRGFTVDVIVFDEAQELSENALEALLSTNSATPSRNPQWIFTGTPPGPDAAGEVFTRIRRDAMRSKPHGLAWAEWSLPDDPLSTFDLDDLELWRTVNPGLEPGRLNVNVILGERARMSDEGFARERLGWWGVRDWILALVVVDRDVWDALAIPPSGTPETGTTAFGVKFSTDAERVAIGVALAPELELGRTHVEGLGVAPVSTGVRDLVEYLAVPERWADASIVLDGRSGTGDLLAELVRAGVPRRRLHVVTTDEAIAAHTGMLRAIEEGRLSHLAQPGLDAAVYVAGKRKIGMTGAWGWTPTTPDGDVLVLDAVTLAHWAATSRRPIAGRPSERLGVLL